MLAISVHSKISGLGGLRILGVKTATEKTDDQKRNTFYIITQKLSFLLGLLLNITTWKANDSELQSHSQLFP